MKHFIFLFIFAALCGNSFSQTISIVDKTTVLPVSNVAITNPEKTILVYTDNSGKADISGFVDEPVIIIQHQSYAQQIFSYGQLKTLDKNILLSPKTISLEEVVVSASKFEEKRSDIAQQVQVIRSKDIENMNQQNTADLMTQSGNVWVQKSQQGGGSPVIRGFEASKVLMVVDGVRMNNAIYRAGHLQNILTIDNNMLDKTEIVFGPGSVVYGSDALGGVMHFHTKNPLLADSTKRILVKGNAFTRYSSANEEKTEHVDFNIGTKKLAFLTSVSYSDFGDLTSGSVYNPFYGNWGKRKNYVERVDGKDSIFVNNDISVQKFTAYQQYDLLEKILFQQSKKVSHTLNFQYSNSSNIPRYDRLTDMSGGKLATAEWYYGPQTRMFGSYALNLNASKGIYSQARITLAMQSIDESRHDRALNSSKLRHKIEHVDVYSLNADLMKNLTEKHELRYGVEATYNDVTSKAYRTNIKTEEETPADSRYPDGGSTVQSIAAYLTHSWEISDKFIINDGLRYSNITLESKFIDKTFFPFPFDEIKQNNSALNGNLGLVFMPGSDWRFTLLGSSGFRAPNVDDMTKVFESAPGTLIVPNPDIKPEYTYNGEIGIGKTFSKKVRAEITGFYTMYENLISTKAFTFNGADSVEYSGVKSKVYAQQNSEHAYLYGTSAAIYADLTDNFSIVSTLNYTYGRIKTDTTDYPLDHIAPMFGKTSFILNLKKFRSEFFMLYNGAKYEKDYNLLGEDNQIYSATGSKTRGYTPAWITFNLRTAYSINKYLQVQLALDNILDTHYRYFSSGISAPGRNVSCTLRCKF